LFAARTAVDAANRLAAGWVDERRTLFVALREEITGTVTVCAGFRRALCTRQEGQTRDAYR
jgi:hypothetical protein